MNQIENIAYVCGIDALYFFVQSGAGYDDIYLDILNQIDQQEKNFKALEYAYQDNEIILTLNDIDVPFSGKGRDGFLWFNHEFFRVGFKDPCKNKTIHDIRVQVNAIGIYTLGLNSLIDYITTVFLKGMVIHGLLMSSFVLVLKTLRRIRTYMIFKSNSMQKVFIPLVFNP